MKLRFILSALCVEAKRRKQQQTPSHDMVHECANIDLSLLIILHSFFVEKIIENKLSRYLGQTDLRAQCAAIKSAFVFKLWHFIYLLYSINSSIFALFFFDILSIRFFLLCNCQYLTQNANSHIETGCSRIKITIYVSLNCEQNVNWCAKLCVGLCLDFGMWWRYHFKSI